MNSSAKCDQPNDAVVKLHFRRLHGGVGQLPGEQWPHEALPGDIDTSVELDGLSLDGQTSIFAVLLARVSRESHSARRGESKQSNMIIYAY